MGYARRRPRPANGNSHSSALKPVSKKSFRGLWIGGLLLFVIGMVALCLVYKGDSKKDQFTETPPVVGTEIVDGIEWAYRVSGDKAEIGNGRSAAIMKSATGMITIPPKLGGYRVARIGASAFSDCSGLESVIIPDSVTSIGRFAFSGCEKLRSVTMPDSVASIGSAAFNGCERLRSMTIPGSVTSVGGRVFDGCSGLKSILVADGNKNYKSANGLLLSKDGKTLIQGVNGDVMIPDGVTRIEDYAFFGRKAFQSVTIPNGVTSIGDFAFRGCERLRIVTIPNSVTSIGREAFSNSGLKSISVAVGNKNYKSVNGLLLSKDSKTLIQGVNGDVTIPDSVTRIGDYAFSNCGALYGVTIPGSVTSIGNHAFSNCSALQRVMIPDNVTTIGDFAFGGCISLQSVTIPNSVMSIGVQAFIACKDSLFDTRILGVKLVDGWAVGHTDSLLGNLDLAGARGIGGGAFEGCAMLRSVMIPDSVTSIGDRAFGHCSGLKSILVAAENSNYKSANGLLLSKDGRTLIHGVNGDVTIPDSVTSIREHAFYRCEGLKSFAVDFGNVNFKAVSGLLLTKDGKTLVSVPGGITGSVVIPDGVTCIGPSAFSWCSRLSSVTIPDSVTTIGDHAFHGCAVYDGVTIPSGVRSIGSYAYCQCHGLECVMIPDGVTTIERNAFSFCSGLKSVTIPDSVTSIGQEAFMYCDGLKSVVIPDSVTSIGKRAFADCSSLESVRLPRRLEGKLDSSVFDECSEDIVITYYGRRTH